MKRSFLESVFVLFFVSMVFVLPSVYSAVKKGKAEFEEVVIGGVNVSQAVMGVGSVQQSILTEAQFQTQMGTDWVKLKGQSIAGSKLCTQYSICTLPNAEGRFLRDSVSDAGLRTTVNDTTAKNGLTNSTSSVSATGTSGGSRALFKSANYGINEGAHTHAITVSSHYHYSGEVHTSTAGAAYGSSTRSTYLYKDGNLESTSAKIIYRTSSTTPTATCGAASWSTGATFNTNSLDSATYQDTHTHTLSVSGTAAAQTITGDTETAPDHLIVNTFVKIN